MTSVTFMGTSWSGTLNANESSGTVTGTWSVTRPGDFKGTVNAKVQFKAYDIWNGIPQDSNADWRTVSQRDDWGIKESLSGSFSASTTKDRAKVRLVLDYASSFAVIETQSFSISTTSSTSSSDTTESSKTVTFGPDGDKQVTYNDDTSSTSDTPDPANIVVTSIEAQPSNPEPEETVQVSVTAKNKGDESGASSFPVVIHNDLGNPVGRVGTYNFALAGGQSRTKTKSVRPMAEADYTYKVAEKSTAVTVEKSNSTDSNTSSGPESSDETDSTNTEGDAEAPPSDGMGTGPDGQQDQTDAPAPPSSGNENQPTDGSQSSPDTQSDSSGPSKRTLLLVGGAAAALYGVSR